MARIHSTRRGRLHARRYVDGGLKITETRVADGVVVSRRTTCLTPAEVTALRAYLVKTDIEAGRARQG